MSKRGNLYDPNRGRFDIIEAEKSLGLDGDNEKKEMIRLSVATDLLCAHAGITDEQVQMAYEQRIRTYVAETVATLRSIVGDDLHE
jgi:hypothetical protein